MLIILDTQVKHKLFALIKILIDGGYYATERAAAEYVVNIYAFIDTIPFRAMRKTKNNRHGEFYGTYKANRRTTWYITFDVQDDTYLVRNVLNNHTKDYPKFIGGLMTE